MAGSLSQGSPVEWINYPDSAPWPNWPLVGHAGCYEFNSCTYLHQSAKLHFALDSATFSSPVLRTARGQNGWRNVVLHSHPSTSQHPELLLYHVASPILLPNPIPQPCFLGRFMLTRARADPRIRLQSGLLFQSNWTGLLVLVGYLLPLAQWHLEKPCNTCTGW